MKKVLFTLLVVAVALVPVLADAQAADPKKSPGASSPSGGAPAGAGTSTSPSASPSTTSPAASPSTSGDFSQYKTQMECEKAGGQWQAASKLCDKK